MIGYSTGIIAHNDFTGMILRPGKPGGPVRSVDVIVPI